MLFEYLWIHDYIPTSSLLCSLKKTKNLTESIIFYNYWNTVNVILCFAHHDTHDDKIHHDKLISLSPTSLCAISTHFLLALSHCFNLSVCVLPWKHKRAIVIWLSGHLRRDKGEWCWPCCNQWLCLFQVQVFFTTASGLFKTSTTHNTYLSLIQERSL